jgi:hypothetical protein
VAGFPWLQADCRADPDHGRHGPTPAGTELDSEPGQITALPQRHDAWVIGDEPVVLVDWWGASNYAKG